MLIIYWQRRMPPPSESSFLHFYAVFGENDRIISWRHLGNYWIHHLKSDNNISEMHDEFSVFAQIDCVHYMSKKGKSPWISYNDDDVADSHFCIEYLNEKFGECVVCFVLITTLIKSFSTFVYP